MENSVGLGGITLVVAALVWLAIFVPGFSKRSELKANSSLVRKDTKTHIQRQPMTQDEQLRRLLNTQRGFSVMFAMFLIGAIATAVAAMAEASWWIGFATMAVAGVVTLSISRLAGKHAARLAAAKYQSRQMARSQARNHKPSATSREWSPNPIPAPLNQPQVGEIADNFAPVVELAATQSAWASKDLDAILARRRAI